MKSINPNNLELIKEYQEDSPETVVKKIHTAYAGFLKYRNISLEKRKSWMKRMAADLRKNSGKYGKIMTKEMGKPLAEAHSEVEKCAWACEYYADNAANFLQEEKIETDAVKSVVRYEPLGVILAIMPWNFPFWQVFRFAAPTLMAGNTVVLKHASNVQGCAMLIEEIINKAGFPEGCFQNLAIPSERVEEVLTNPLIKAATVTGSEKAGSSVAAICGKEIKPTVLELGGSNSFIVLEDADLDKAASLAVKARMINNAQSCIAAKRFIIMDSVYEEFRDLFIKKIKKLKQGDPMDDDTDVGPLARVDLAEDLEDQLQKSLDMGARLLYGGKREDAHFQPTVIENVSVGMPAYDDELFGPVAPLFRVKDVEEAILLSNDTRFGLGVTIVTEDTGRAEKFISGIEDGAVFINELVKSDPRLPFGGTKKSGYGRELSRHGIREFVNAKTIYINKSVNI